MRAKLTQYLYRLRASYWFVPSVMALGAIVLSFVTIRIDNSAGQEWLTSIGMFYANTPEGARSVLGTIAGSMITVAGVTFSMTIVSVSFASAQFGPRLIGNFMRDRGNQITLGTFISTYIYCLLVLRTVRAAETVSETASAADAFDAFVPHVSVLCGILMALASVGVLIYFIHHIPETIDVSNITASIGRELQRKIDSLFPDHIGAPPETVAQRVSELPAGCFDRAREVSTDSSGYLQAVDEEGLLETAREYDLIIRLHYRPGDFSTPNRVLLAAWPGERVDDNAIGALRNAFAWGSERTPTQNALFLVDQLIEIIGRALSPGINDPFTAISCLKWLERSLVTLARREIPEPRRYDEDGDLRVVAHATSFATFCEAAFGKTRQYIAGDRNVTLEALEVIAGLLLELPPGDRRETLLAHADALAAAEQRLEIADDQEEIRRRCDLIHRMTDDAQLVDRLRDRQDWVGGRA